MKLGSLFDGSGTCPLATSAVGITPAWASEVEPYPVAVTRSRFPSMTHLGSVTDIHGEDIEPVDIITFGSPCQDLSVAGKRAGLKHESNGDDETTRSGLFMEAVRIIKEMREATNGEYPTFAVWENVPGAFSSNKGEDFRTVLEELIKIVEPTAVMPEVPKNGWSYADSYCGDGWSLAYRVLDAQYWGVPQRRRRIYLVLDLRGQCAREVLFEREGLRRNYAKSGTPWQSLTSHAEDRSGANDRAGYGAVGLTNRGFCSGDKSETLRAESHGALPMAIVLDDQGGQQITVRTDGKAPTLRAETHGNLPCVLESAGFKAGQSMAGGIGWQKECATTLAAQCSGTEPTVCVKKAYSIENHPADSRVDIDDSGKVQTLTSRMGTGGGNVPMVLENIAFCMAHGQSNAEILDDKAPVCCLQGNGIDRADTAGCNGKGWKENTSYTLNTIDRPAVVYCTDIGFFNSQEEEVAPTLLARQYKDPYLVSYPENAFQYIIRRLTPTECARLQGFPNNWGHPDHKEDFTDEEYRFWLDVRNTHAAINGKPQKDYTKDQMLSWYNKLHTDSSEYKMWGNGMAFPCVLYIMEGVQEVLAERYLDNLFGGDTAEP